MPNLASHGLQWLVDATGCDPARLQDRQVLQDLFDEIVRDLDLHPVGRARWHRFPVTCGLTGYQMLSESHLACHTFPEYGGICLDVFCCRARPGWPWAARLAERLGAADVSVRTCERNYRDPVIAPLGSTRSGV